MKNLKVLGIIVLAVMVILAGCGTAGGDNVDKPEDTVKTCLKAIQDGKFDSIDQYFLYADSSFGEVGEDEETEMFIEAFKKMEYKILDSSIDGENAKVKTKITSPDMGEVMGQLMISAISYAINGDSEEVVQEKMTNDLKELLASKDLSMFTSEITINLKLEDGKWLIVGDDIFVNAITGNLLDVLSELE